VYVCVCACLCACVYVWVCALYDVRLHPGGLLSAYAVKVLYCRLDSMTYLSLS
jgi:hypothetical protein